MTKKFLCGLLANCSLFLAGAMADPTLTLDPPNGAISGLAGSTVGWGFTLTNNTNYLVVDSAAFCLTHTLPCVPSAIGSYNDFAGPQFIVVGPSPESPSVTQAFDNTAQQGTGSFSFNPDATGQDNGFIILVYDLYSVSPNDGSFNPEFDTISVGNILTAPASVTVGSPVPEPVTLPLLGLALIAGALLRRRKVA